MWWGKARVSTYSYCSFPLSSRFLHPSFSLPFFFLSPSLLNGLCGSFFGHWHILPITAAPCRIGPVSLALLCLQSSSWLVWERSCLPNPWVLENVSCISVPFSHLQVVVHLCCLPPYWLLYGILSFPTTAHLSSLFKITINLINSLC